MKPPTSQKEVQTFIGVISHYRNIWSSQSHMVAPLPRFTSIKTKFKWTQVEKVTFDEIKQIMACDNLSTYPNFI